jgi:phage FluMu gp28-like protein
MDAYARRTDWLCVSSGERAALEWMRKVKAWVNAAQLTIEHYDEERPRKEALLLSATATLPNGSRIISIPSNPATARGYSANMVLDEFAHHEKQGELWKAVFPSITKGRKKIRVVSTPNGVGDIFFRLCHDAAWSQHKVTILDAVAGGMVCNVDELRAGLADPDAWAQEYDPLDFCDVSSTLLPYELIASCESDEATESCDWNGHRPPNPLASGIDFGRKRDKTCSWTLERIGDVLWTRDVLTLAKAPTPDQVEILAPRIKVIERACLDYTGPGLGMGDYMVKELGEYNPDQHRFGKVELCTFSNAFLCEIMSKMKMLFESKKVRIPVSRRLRESLHSIRRVVTPAGNITYRAPHTDDGHADEAYALALAIRAATERAPAGYSATLI